MRRILVIDDDPDLREVIELGLQMAGWAVVTAASGAEGLALAATHLPDAIILDMMMPGMDGHAVLEALKAEPVTRDIPVLFLSAKLQNPLEAAAESVIPKPFDPLRLPAIIAERLGWG